MFFNYSFSWFWKEFGFPWFKPFTAPHLTTLLMFLLFHWCYSLVGDPFGSSSLHGSNLSQLLFLLIFLLIIFPWFEPFTIVIPPNPLIHLQQLVLFLILILFIFNNYTPFHNIFVHLQQLLFLLLIILFILRNCCS